MEVIKISEQAIEKAIKALKAGKVIVCPTDTVYGLLADAENKKAIGKIFKIKSRPENKPLGLFVKDIKEAKRIACINSRQEKFLKKVWPVFSENTLPKKKRKQKPIKIASKVWAEKGKVTVILKLKDKKLEPLSNNKTIGIRVVDYDIINKILKKTKKPLVQTSANISGSPAETRIQEVINQFKHGKIKPDLVLDAGDLPKSKSSVVLVLAAKKIKVLRK